MTYRSTFKSPVVDLQLVICFYTKVNVVFISVLVLLYSSSCTGGRDRKCLSEAHLFVCFLRNVNLSVLMVVWVIQVPNSMLLFTISEKQAGVTGNIFKNTGVGRHAHSVVKGNKVKTRSVQSTI